MIDPITAFATAQAAVAGIKKAVQLGKDINGLIGEFSKFFDAKDALQKAANDLGKSGKSDTSKALEIVMQTEQLRAQEEELKHILLYGYGSADLWDQLLIQRQKIRQEREKSEREAKKRKAASKKLMLELAAYSFIAAAFCALLIFTIYVIMHV
jgi:hypothetical protein